MLVPVALGPNLVMLPVFKRVSKRSVPLKLVNKFRRNRLEKATLSSNLGLLVGSLSVSAPPSPNALDKAKIASPFSFVVVEKRFPSNSAVRASKEATRPRIVASSAENSSCNLCRVAKSSLVTRSAVVVAISSLTLSRQAFKPAANS
ncbi:hypothetical protein RINTHM_7550 [Richelia intracellularis HM01]|nr:hypothetical protein RINTHM_7550 [Richelia intracellularis HM01]